MLRRSALRTCMHAGMPEFGKPRILITGSNGQIGSELSKAFRSQYGKLNVIGSDVRKPPSASHYEDGPFMFLDVMDRSMLEKVIVDHNVTRVIHLSAIMSVLGEAQPQKCIDLNIKGLTNVLELARIHKLRVFAPSTMAVFSPESGQTLTKDVTILNPSTVYGITKVFLEQLGQYYGHKYGVDFRSLRYPGIISAETVPGGGTTDYAVWMFHYALEGKKYTCPVFPNEPLPMMYMPDCLRGTVDFITAPRDSLSRNVYNITGMSFTPDQLHQSIKKFIPGFEVEYEADVAQTIAASWPDSMDDTNAAKDFGWKPEWDIDRMTHDMLVKIAKNKGIQFNA